MASTANTNIVNSYYQAILRFTPPASLAAVYAAQLDAGTLTALQLQNQLLSSAQASTIPGILVYDLAYNTTPAGGPTGGVTSLANYATALQSGNYTFNSAGQIVLGTTVGQYSSLQFSLQNVYVNLGATFAADPKSTFNATYGSMDRATFINQVYSQIFGHGPGADTQQYLLNNFQFYVTYSGSEIGAKGAIAGVLLYAAEQGGFGSYPAAANALLSAAAVSLANTGTDSAKYGSELVATYGSVPANSVALTTGKDTVTASLTLSDLTPFLYNGIGPTLNQGDSITGVAGVTNNTFIINDQFGTGTDVIPAGVAITNVQTIDLTTQGNAGGASPAVQGAGQPGTASGVFDVTTSAATTASLISGVKVVNITSAGSLVDNVRVDPGLINAVDVTVNHQHVNGANGGVQVLGGHNVTVNDGDGATPGTGAGVTIGSATVVNTNSIDLNPTGAIIVNEIGNNKVTAFGGNTVAITDLGGGAITVGDPNPLASLSYPSDEPVTSVVIVDNANVQAGVISVFGSAPVTSGGTTTFNATTATVNSNAVLGNAITVGAVNAIGGINNSYSPSGNVTVTAANKIAVGYNYATGTQTGFAPGAGITTATVIGGATVNVTTNANSVVVGSAVTNGNGTITVPVPVAGANPSADTIVFDSAVVGTGAGGATVTTFGSKNTTISNAGGAITVGAIAAGNVVIAPTGAINISDQAPLTYDNVINLGTNRDVTAIGGTTVNVNTNAGAVTVGDPAGIAVGAEPSGVVAVVDTASPGVNAGAEGGTDVPITIFGGTNVSAYSANGAILIGNSTTATNPSGTVTTTTSGIETGGQFRSTTTVNGAGKGGNVLINTTGAGGAVTAGVKATPLTGTVVINDTFAGTQNADSFNVVGGVGSATVSAVAITTTKTSGAITVGGVAPALDITGTKLSNAPVFANGNVTVVNETPANTGVAGATNLWGTGATAVSANGAAIVAIAGGGAATILDVQTTKATGGANAGKAIGASTLTNVFLDHVGTGGSASTITSDALAVLTILDDTAGDNYTVVAGPALALALNIGNDAALNKTTTVTDATASAVNVADNGKATAGTLAIVAAKATSASFTTTAALKVDLTASTALTSITAANTAALNLGDLSGAAVAVTAGSGSTGAVTITNLNGATSSFNGAGSSGNDSVTITTSNVTKGIRAGGGATNTITANYGAGAGDAALSSVTTGFNVLGIGKNGTSAARQDVVTVAAVGAVGATYQVNVTVNGVSTSFTYTQVAGDTTATVATNLITGLNAKLASVGVSAFAVPVAGSTTSFNIIAQAGLAMTTSVVPSVPGALTDAMGGATVTAYNATGFGTLTVGALANAVTFSNVGNAEILNITADPGAGNSVTLQPTAATNSLTVNLGVDGPATGVGAGSAPITNAVVNTTKTANLAINSLGQGGTTVNKLTLNDPAANVISVGGDNSLTLTVPALDSAFPGFTTTDSAFSAVNTITAANTSISTQPGSKNITDVTGVVVAATGVSVTGGASLIKAAGVQGTDFAIQTDTITLTGDFTAGEVVTATFTPTFGYSIVGGVLTLGAIASAPITASYTVQASDLVGGTTLAHEQAVAAQLAGVINTTAGLNLAASAPTTNLVNGQLVVSGTTNTRLFTDGGLSGTLPPIPPGTPTPVPTTITSVDIAGGVTYTKAADNYVTGSGGGVITLGAGGGYNPYATVTANGKTYFGVFDTGYEQVNLSASTAKTDTINVGPNAIATFGGVNGTGGQNGGVIGFQEGATATADTLNFTDTSGYTVITNIKAATQLDLTTGSKAANIAAALDPSGALANALANVNFSSANGVITVVGNGTSQPPSVDTKVKAAEIIVALAAGTVAAANNAAGAIAAVSDGNGNTYVVSANAGNLFATFAAVPPTGSATSTLPPLNTLNSASTGLSVVELLGTPTVTGFGSFQAAGALSFTTAPLDPVSGIGAQGAVLANVINPLANLGAGNLGVAGTSKTYDDTGASHDKLTATQAVTSTVTTYNNLAPAAQLDIAGGGSNVGTVVVTQTGASGANSLLVDFQSAGDTVQSLTTTGDWKIRLVADAAATLKNLIDTTNTVPTLEVTGAAAFSLGTITDTALTTIDASKQTGALTLTGVNFTGLAIKGALGGDNLTASGLTNTITVGNATPTGVITASVIVTATGNGDVVTLVNSATGNVNNLNVGGVGDTISVDTGTNNLSGGATGGPVFGLTVPLQSSDTINLADGGTDNVWVGGSSTVNLTGNTGTSTFGGLAAATTAFGKGGIVSTANVAVKGDTTGTTSAGFATGGTGALTTITGADVLGGNGHLNLTFLNAGTGGTEALAGGSLATAFVNVEAAAIPPTTLAAALDADVIQSLVMDAQINPGLHTSVVAGVLDLNAKTGVFSWFQFQGNTYVVEAANSTGAAAAHAGLQATDTVVKLTGLVDLTQGTGLGGSILNIH